MARFTQVNLSGLASPAVVEPLDYEAAWAAYKDKFLDLWAEAKAENPSLPDFDVDTLETDPAMIIGQAGAYRETIFRARVNDAARAVMLAFAAGSDLDHLGALFGVDRLAGETDARFRRRVQLAPEAFSCAGAEGGYIFHTLTAAPALRDATAIQVAPGTVLVTALAGVSDPIPGADVLAAIRARLHQPEIKPLTDMVRVAAPIVQDTRIRADLTLYEGPAETVVLNAARAAIDAFVEKTMFLGFDLKRSALFSRLHQEGVHSVNLIEPAADIDRGPTECFRVTGIDIRVVGRDE